MNLVCIAKVARIKMKKNGSEKLIKLPKTGSFVKQTVATGLFNLTRKRRRRIHFILYVVVISGTDLGSSLPYLLHCRNYGRIALLACYLSEPIMTIQHQ